MDTKEKDGVLSLPLAVVLMVFSSAGISLLAMGGYWRAQVKVQLQLDECVGTSTLELRDRLNAIDRITEKMDSLRTAAATALASGNTGALISLRKLIQFQAILQEKELLLWKKHQATSWLKASCSRDKKNLPDLPLERFPPDLVGEKPFRWNPLKRKILEVSIAHSRRISRGFVFLEPEPLKQNWTASWRLPRAFQ